MYLHNSYTEQKNLSDLHYKCINFHSWKDQLKSPLSFYTKYKEPVVEDWFNFFTLIHLKDGSHNNYIYNAIFSNNAINNLYIYFHKKKIGRILERLDGFGGSVNIDPTCSSYNSLVLLFVEGLPYI